MAETLRELVVALSLDSGNFTRNIKTINLQIKEAESSFKLAGAGVDKFADTAAGSAAKIDMLGRRLDLQKVAANEYSKRLSELNSELNTTKKRHADYERRLESARMISKQLAKQVDNATDAYQAYAKTLGDTDSVTIEAKKNLDELNNEYAESKTEITKIEGQLKAYKKNIRDTDDSITRAKIGLNNVNAEMAETQVELAKTRRKLIEQESAWYQAGDAIENFGKKASQNSDTWVNAGKALTTGLTTPLLALGATAVKSAIDYESAFASVKKTVDGTDADYSRLSSGIQQMSTELAMSAEDIAELVAIAGQLGIEKDTILDFTKTMIDLGNSTNVSAETAATSLARFANITGMVQTDENWRALGSAIVDLGNNFATTESEIIEMAYRLAAAGKQVGMTEDQILGISAALSSVGIEAQMGGSAFSKALVKMEVAAETGGEALEDFAAVSGMTGEQFKEVWDSDPTEAFMLFVDGLAKMDEEGASAIVTLQDIGINEVRLRDTMLRTVNAHELFNEALDLSNNAWKENTALTDEANKRYATTASKLTNLKNKGIKFIRQFAEDQTPAIQSMIDSVDDLLETFMGLDKGQREIIQNFALGAAGLGPALLAYGKVKKGIGSVTKEISAAAKYFGSIGAAAREAGGGLGNFFSAAMSKPGVVIALTAAVAAGAIAFYDWVSGAKAAREALEGMEKTAESWKNTAAETFYGRENAGLAGLGLDESAFKAQIDSTEGWMDRLISDWNDNKRESDEAVNAWVESYKALNDDVRQELTKLDQTAAESGHTEYSAQIQQDMAMLDKYDAEVEKLLKKRKGRNLTEKEQIKLQDLIDARDALVVKYELRPADGKGFDEIRSQLENTLARASAAGDMDMQAQAYEDAIVAAAQGMSVINQELNEQYDKERDLIKLMEDGEEQDAALAELDQRYAADRIKATEEYAKLLSEVYGQVFEQDGMQETAKQIEDLYDKLSEYAMLDSEGKKGMLSEIQTAMANMDEGALVEYLALLEQIKGLETEGVDLSGLFPDVDFDATEKLAQVQQFLKESGELSGLSEGIEAVVEETLSIATDLDMEPAKATWEAFAADPGSLVSSRLKLSGYDAIAYRQFMAANSQNPVSIKGRVSPESMTEEELKKAVFGENTTFWKDGVQVPFSAEVQNQLSKENFLLALDEDGGYHVVITAKAEGTEETVKKAQEELDKTNIGFTLLGEASGLQDVGWKDIVDNATRILNVAARKDKSWWETMMTPPESIDNILAKDIEPRQDQLIAYLQELAQYKATGKELTEQESAEVESIIKLLEAMDTAEVGEDIIAGVLEGMQATDLAGDAELTRDNLIDALNTAFDIHSPAGAMEPTGGHIAAGVGKGMAEYPIENDVAEMRRRLMAAMNGFELVGMSTMAALAAGITGGKNIAVSAMKTAAGEIVEEALAQFSVLAAQVVRNANVSLGYIGGGSGGTTNNRTTTKNTYNQQSTTNVTGNTFVLNDTASVRQLRRDLAIENARTSKGYGL